MSFGPNAKFSWVTPFLSIGAEPVESDLDTLDRAGVRAILNVKRSDDLRHAATRAGFQYAHEPIGNSGTPDFLVLMRCCRFLDSQRELGNPVLVHCALGIGRSATVVLAYLMLDGHTLTDALDLLRKQRPAIDPSSEQLYAASAFARDAARSAGHS